MHLTVNNTRNNIHRSYDLMLHFTRPKLFCGNYENNSFIKYEVYNICLVNLINHRFGILKSQICMVGDRLDTDILFGQNGGCKTLLVLSGN